MRHIAGAEGLSDCGDVDATAKTRALDALAEVEDGDALLETSRQI
jgi:hypothetical protein